MTDAINEFSGNIAQDNAADKVKACAIFSLIFIISALPIIMYMMKDYILILTHMYNYGGTFEENVKMYEEHKIKQAKIVHNKTPQEPLDPLTQYMLNDLMGDMPYIPHNDQ